MAIVFINDHPFYTDHRDNVFTSGTLTSDIWSRFTDNFGELTVIGRGKKIGDREHNYVSADAPKVKFDLFYEIKGGIDYFRYRKLIIKKLTPHIKNSQFIVLRLPSSIGVIAAQLCKKYKRKYFVEVVGCAYDSMRFFGNIQGKLLAGYTAKKNKKAIYNASRVVYVTKKYLQDRYPNPNKYINASNVVIENFDNEVLSQHLKLLSNDLGPKNIGMIGNVALPYKGYEVLFKALQLLKLDYHLTIVGGGDDNWIKQLIAKNNLENKITLAGRINTRTGIFNFLDKLDLYVQPSFTEGLPRGVIEAMARACPIVASNVGGIPELVDENYIYDAKDHVKLSQLLSKALSNSEILKRLSEENFLRSKEYSFENVNKRRYQYFNEIKEQVRNK